jgi:Putative transposase/Transposase zinc-binding domain
MTEHRLEVADVFRTYEKEFFAKWGHVIGPHQRKAFEAIRDCRTAALGGHVEYVEQCDTCGHQVISYNSCRNRHCPKCQAMARAKWLAERETELLPVPYFHVVFTLPVEIGRLALQNAEEIYRILFCAAAETLLTIAADPRRLGANIGFLAVLHTWGQNLHLHPHLHCVVPGGGISPDGLRWIGCRKKTFFLPVKVLSCRFRNLFLLYLRKAYKADKLRFHGELAELAGQSAFETLCRTTKQSKWVVFAKPPFGGPEQVLKYLARYTHRVAISNRRLLSIENDCVRFEYKDYAHGNQTKVMTLAATEFIRRFLLHILPSGFVRIRQFGFLSNRERRKKLASCRHLLGVSALSGPVPVSKQESAEREPKICPACGCGRMIRLAFVPDTHSPNSPPHSDSS